jgi:hypothetical protein
LWNLLQSVSHSAKAFATFSAYVCSLHEHRKDLSDVHLADITSFRATTNRNLSADSTANRVTVDVGSTVAVPGVSYWVLVVSNEDSSAEYTLTTTFSDEGAASTLSSPFSALF